MSTSGTCKNCKTQLLASYCHNCGQKEQDLQRPFYSLVVDSLRETFDVDGRLARTLGILFVKPGALTESYLAGRRQQYTPPLRLYLVVSLLFFLIVASLAQQGFLFEVTASTSDEVRVLAEQLPRMMFICLPVFALLLKLLYRSYYYFEHLIHALHLHTAAYITLMLILPFERTADESRILVAAQVCVFAYMILYLVVSQRRVYAGNWFSVIAKTGVLFFVYTMLLGSLLELASALEAVGGIKALW